MTVIGVLLILAGAAGPLSWWQWRSGNWLRAAAAIESQTSPRFLASIPAAGLVVMALGLAIVWSALTWLPFVVGAAWIWQLASKRWGTRPADEIDRRIAEEAEEIPEERAEQRRRAS